MKLNVLSKKLFIKTAIIIILFFNGVSYAGAYIFTHHKNSNKFSLGVSRPGNYRLPTDLNLEYATHKIPINNNEWLDSWLIKSSVTNTKGIVILFHGKIGTKSSLLDAAKVFNDLGYDTLTIDFRGAGASSGNKSTIGVEESEDVVAAVNYSKQLNLNKPVILYGISMGSAAILRAISKHNIQPDAIILELPFTTLLKAVQIRLKNESLPPSPMAELIVFWGSIQHGFNGFAHKPIEYAKDVKSPTLILAGERDRTMPITEVQKLYQNLDVPKNMVVFPQAGHQVLSRSHGKLWTQAIKDFL